jgi:hypothetical protein
MSVTKKANELISHLFRIARRDDMNQVSIQFEETQGWRDAIAMEQLLCEDKSIILIMCTHLSSGRVAIIVSQYKKVGTAASLPLD